MKTISLQKKINGLKRSLVILLSFLITLQGYCQHQLADQKISPTLLQKIQSKIIIGESNFIITVQGNNLPTEIKQYKYVEIKINTGGNFSFFNIQATVGELLSQIITQANVTFVEDASRKPTEELQVSKLDLSVNKINLAHSKFPQWNGDGITVSVKEDKPDTTDIDFKGRFLTTNLASAFVSNHAAVMATMIAGGGNSWHLGKGAAWGSTISSSNFATLLPDATAAYQQYNITVQNHSYGVGVENYYGADAAAYDASVITTPSLLHVFSSGNSGTAASSTGTYSGLTGFANVTGSFKMSKNSIVVGATDSFNVVATLSSKGPAHDGRVKPELVALGEDGSSGAAALTSGTVLLLQQCYKQLYGSLPASSLMKAVLINSADDVGNTAIDYASGYGSLNAFKALKTLQLGRFLSGSVAQSGTRLFNIAIPSGIKKIHATLVWIDPPAAPNATKALVNDIDLDVTNTTSGQNWQPWVLNAFPHPDSLQQTATRKRDSLNNAEQVTIENPVAGTYQFRVSGYDVTTISQDFYLAYQFDSTDVFEWQSPGSNDFVFSSSEHIIRWSSSFNNNTGLLEFSLNDGLNWQIIDGTVNLQNGYYKWSTPNLISNALLRMTVNGQQFTSDSFTISQRTSTSVGFNCADSFLFYWSKIPGINNYRVYKLGSKYLEPIITTSDSFFVLPKNSNASLHYAVAPLIANKEGMKSYTFNYTTQGVGCYIRSFLSSLFNNEATLNLSLGTLYGINKIVVEKLERTGFVAIQQQINPFNLSTTFSDAALKKGLNIYRIKLELTGGGVVYSQQETVYYLSGSNYLVYPNPVQQNQPINILGSDSPEETKLLILNTKGSKIAEYAIDETLTKIPAIRLSKGMYIFHFIRSGQRDESMKVIVY